MTVASLSGGGWNHGGREAGTVIPRIRASGNGSFPVDPKEVLWSGEETLNA